MTLGHFFGQSLGVGGCGVAKFMDKGLNDVVVLFAFLADFDIRANGKAVKGNLALLSPFG